jgi:D-serine deaminase-like pyridoxal phosphate-dependent protein
LRATAEASGEAAAAARALGEALRLLFDIDEDSPARAREELRLVQAALDARAEQ